LACCCIAHSWVTGVCAAHYSCVRAIACITHVVRTRVVVITNNWLDDTLARSLVARSGGAKIGETARRGDKLASGIGTRG